MKDVVSMGQVLEAVYERGTFRPVDPLAIPEGQRVSISVEPLPMTKAEADAYLGDWRRLYDGLSEEEIARVEAAVLDRSHFSRIPDLRLDCWTSPIL